MAPAVESCRADGLGVLEGGVQVSFWTEFGGILGTEWEGILEGGGDGFCFGF